MKITKILIILLVMITSLNLVNATSTLNLTENLVEYWTMDGSALAYVSPLHDGLTTSVTNSLMYGIINEGYLYDVAGSQINAGTETDLGQIGDFSVSTWVWSSTDSQNGALFTRLSAGFVANPYQVIVGVNGSIVMYVGNGASQQSVSFGNRLTFQDWQHVVITKTGNICKLYLDGALDSTKTMTAITPSSSAGRPFVIGNNNNNYAFKGYIDEFALFSDDLNITQIEYLYATGSPTSDQQPPFATEIIYTLYKNNLSKSDIFQESDDIYYRVNITNSSNEFISGLDCNLTFDGEPRNHITFEIPLKTTNNDTICSNGVQCDFLNQYPLIEYNKSSIITPVTEYYFHLNICELNNGANLNILVGNQSGVYLRNITVLTASIPSCVNGYNNILFNTSITGEKLFLNITSNAMFPNKLFIEEIEIEETYNQLLTISLTENTSFYQSDFVHEYYSQSEVNSSLFCTNGTFNVTDTHNIIIGNLKPSIIIDGLSTTCEDYIFTTNSTIPYCDDNFVFISSSITDLQINLSTNVSVNCSGYGIIGSNQTINSPFRSILVYFNMSAIKDFDDINNNLKCTYNINSSDGNLVNIRNLNFTIIDIVQPYCFGLNDVISESLNYTFDIDCYDEAIFSFNLTCNNNYSKYADELTATAYNLSETTTLLSLGTTTCLYDICDGHTNNKLERIKPLSLNNKTLKILDKGSSHQVKVTNEKDVLTYKQIKDRIKFTITRKDNSRKDNSKKLKTFNINYKTVSGIYLPSYVYKGWIVDPVTKTWFDINSDQVYDYDIEQTSLGEFNITVYSFNNTIEFESIGELNCITGIFSITPPPPTTEEKMLSYGTCPEDLANMIFLLAVVFIGVVLSFITLITNKYLFFGILGGVCMVVSGFVILDCIMGLGYLFIIFGAIFTVRSLFLSESM